MLALLVIYKRRDLALAQCVVAYMGAVADMVHFKLRTGGSNDCQ